MCIRDRDVTIGGRFDGHGGHHASQAESAQNGQHLPMPLRGRFVNPLPALGSSPKPRHLRGHAAFIQENQPFRRDRTDLFGELLAVLVVGRAVAFLRVKRFFFRRSPIARSTCPTRLLHTRTPLACKRSRNSASVRSGCSCSQLRKRSFAASVTRLAGPCCDCAGRSFCPLRFCCPGSSCRTTSLLGTGEPVPAGCRHPTHRLPETCNADHPNRVAPSNSLPRRSPPLTYPGSPLWPIATLVLL